MLIAREATDISGYIRSFEYIALSASMGYGGAQNEIARIYASGGDLAEYYNSPFFVPDARFEGTDTLIGKAPLADAMNKLGDTFFDGKSSLRKNDEAAARCYRYAAELGHADGCYSYGWCLRHGVGIHENNAEAAKWLKMAADKGNVNAAYSYGLCCEEGSGTGVTNKREAIFYYRMAAGNGHVDAARRFLKLSGADLES
jgi:TPR repeat protein